MTDHSDLIDRLRALPTMEGSWVDTVRNEAVEALSSQSLSLSEARTERDELKKELLAAQGQADEHYHRLLDAQREIERLKKERDDAVSDLCRWRAAFQRFTPGGSEFMNPQAVREWADGLKMQVFEANKRAVLAERKVRENGPAALADATTNLPLSDLSSLRKGAEVAPGDLQLLDRLRRDNTYDGARLVVSGGEDLAQAWRLSEDGLIALEQVARGVRLHITRMGIAALSAALVSGSREDGA